MLKALLIITGCFSVIATALPFIQNSMWWIRIFDFPRIQIMAIALISLVGYYFLNTSFLVSEKIFLAVLLISIIYQLIKILPYTFFFPKQVLDNTHKQEIQNHISLLVCNVQMSNRASGKCMEMMLKAEADIILALETDKWWEKELKELEKIYLYRSYTPLANTYGIILFSKLTLIECEVKYLLSHEVPSIHCIAELRSGIKIKFFGVHPKPPAPGQSKTSDHRDAELVIIGKEAKTLGLPVIVAGDLNDVAWSRTTHLFQKISRLSDPRVGRGLYATYNAQYPLMRWPLDHIFHSSHFKLVELKRMEYIGSDHFPMYIKLNYNHNNIDDQSTPEADAADRKEARKKIKAAK